MRQVRPCCFHSSTGTSRARQLPIYPPRVISSESEQGTNSDEEENANFRRLFAVPSDGACCCTDSGIETSRGIEAAGCTNTHWNSQPSHLSSRCLAYAAARHACTAV